MNKDQVAALLEPAAAAIVELQRKEIAQLREDRETMLGLLEEAFGVDMEIASDAPGHEGVCLVERGSGLHFRARALLKRLGRLP